MEGKTASHYRILKKIGEGGMGEVYLAEDTSLERKVALKFLPDYLQSDEVAQKRFLREAKSAAALDHPYICHIHEVGEADGKNFIAMEYVKGRTLLERLKQGRVSLRETLQIGSEVAEALEKAHSEGIVHRDLKPANIMLTPEGHVKVMDFGLAKRLPEVGDVRNDITAALTREGATVGTLAYMSPEQTRGEIADIRSDIFSFGIVLYQMLTGVHPFGRATQAETSNAILNEQPAPLDRYTEDTSDLLQHTVEKMLEKNASDRYQSVHEVRSNLKKLSERFSAHDVSLGPMKARSSRWVWTGVAVAAFAALIVAVIYVYQPGTAGLEEAPVDSIAILPFENESDDAETATLCGGIPDNIAFKLTQLNRLRVLSPERLRRYIDQEVDPQTVAHELDVKAVLTGTVNVIGETLGLRIRLYDAEGDLLWGQSYNQALTDIFAIQEEIAGLLVEKLQLQLKAKELGQLARNPTENLQAYDAWRNGWNINMDNGDPEQAIQYFNRAIELDPNFGMAHFGLSFPYLNLCKRGEENYCAEHRQAIEEFVNMEEDLPEAQVAKGVLLAYDLDWDAAGEEFRKAQYPTDNSIAYITYLIWMGQLDEAAKHVELASQIVDPLSAREQHYSAWYYWLTRKYDLALQKFRKVRELDPNRSIDWDEWLCYVGKGADQDTFAAFLLMREKQGEDQEKLGRYKQVFRESGMQGLYRFLLNDVGEKWLTAPVGDVGVYALVGEKDLAFERLERYCESVPFIFWPSFPTLCLLDSLRDDVRFEELLRKLNLPEEAIQRHLALPGS